MSAIPSTSQPLATSSGDAPPPVSYEEIDESCRGPLLFLFVSAAVWLLIGSAFALMATLKFHSPNLLADQPWLTYGRVHPAHLNAWLYGFAAQAGLGVMLWLSCHLGRTRLPSGPAVAIGGAFWNIGVTVGVLGILGGENTGYEWLEMPRYASMLLLLSYLVIGLAGMRAYQQRHQRQLYISQWFVLAAFFWFPWIYTTANLLLVANPVRGVLQAAVNWWYMHNLATVWFGLIGLAAIFYFIPKITNRATSHYMGIYIFWMLIFFGSWGGIPSRSPLPAWMAALSTMGGILTIIPVLGVAIAVRRMFGGDFSAVGQSVPLKFIFFGALACVIAGLAFTIGSWDKVSRIIGFSWAIPARDQFYIYGFFAMTMFGAIYYIVPRIAGTQFPAPRLVNAHFWLAALGILIYAVPLGLGGLQQGRILNAQYGAFLDAANSILPFLRFSTLGELLMAAGHVIFLLNLLGLMARLGRTSAEAFVSANVKGAGVAS